MAAQPRRTLGINLLGQVTEKDKKLARFQSVIKQTSFIVLAIYLVLLGAVFGTDYFFTREKAIVDKKGQDLISAIKSLSPTETLLWTVRNRIDLANATINNSPNTPGRLLSTLSRVLPSGDRVAEVTAERDTFNVVLIVPNSEALVKTVQAVTNNTFASVELSELTLREGGVYSLSLNIK